MTQSLFFLVFFLRARLHSGLVFYQQGRIRSRLLSLKAAAGDDYSAAEDEEMSNGERIRWLPPINPSRGRDLQPSGEEGTMVLPLFPLGSIVYTPGTQTTLNIFEPRYRKMYSDILMSGARRFVTTMVNPDNSEGKEFAEVGVVFYLEDLKEVSQQTNDAIKYVCQHKVLDKRVCIHSILNPEDWATRETYLRCEVSELEDTDIEVDTSDSERRLKDLLTQVADMQEENKEDVRFSKEAVARLNPSRGVDADTTLWEIIELWKNFLDARAQASSRKIQGDIQARLVKFLADRGASGKNSDLPKSVNLSDLPADIQRDVKTLRERVLDEVSPLIDEQTKGIQTLLQATTHQERLDLFIHIVDNERRRLVAKRTLKATIASLEASVSSTKADNEEEESDDEEEDVAAGSSGTD